MLSDSYNVVKNIPGGTPPPYASLSGGTIPAKRYTGCQRSFALNVTDHLAYLFFFLRFLKLNRTSSFLIVLFFALGLPGWNFCEGGPVWGCCEGRVEDSTCLFSFIFSNASIGILVVTSPLLYNFCWATTSRVIQSSVRASDSSHLW